MLYKPRSSWDITLTLCFEALITRRETSITRTTEALSVVHLPYFRVEEANLQPHNMQLRSIPRLHHFLGRNPVSVDAGGIWSLEMGPRMLCMISLPWVSLYHSPTDASTLPSCQAD